MDSDADGVASEAFNYYKVLCIQGYLACRKHAERILLLVEMMAHSGCPCFKAGPKVVQNLRKRFNLGRTEEQVAEIMLAMISDSMDAWSTPIRFFPTRFQRHLIIIILDRYYYVNRRACLDILDDSNIKTH